MKKRQAEKKGLSQCQCCKAFVGARERDNILKKLIRILFTIALNYLKKQKLFSEIYYGRVIIV